MPFSEKEMLEDLHEVRIRKYVYVFGGLGILGLSAALVVLFFARHDWPALLLAAVGTFWSVVLFYQAHRTRQVCALIKARLAESGAERPAGGSGGGAAEAGDSAGGAAGDAEGADTPSGGAPGEP